MLILQADSRGTEELTVTLRFQMKEKKKLTAFLCLQQSGDKVHLEKVTVWYIISTFISPEHHMSDLWLIN